MPTAVTWHDKGLRAVRNPQNPQEMGDGETSGRDRMHVPGEERTRDQSGAEMRGARINAGVVDFRGAGEGARAQEGRGGGWEWAELLEELESSLFLLLRERSVGDRHRPMRACCNRVDACIPLAICLSTPWPVFSGGREPVPRRMRTLALCKFGWTSCCAHRWKSEMETV